MNCVSCDEPMVVLEVDEVEIDYCLECGGIWLDSGELGILLGDEDKVQRFLSEAVPAPKKAEVYRKCPICLKKMTEIEIGKGDNKIYIDRCKQSHGLWFDRGELRDVLEFMNHGESAKVAKLLKEIFTK
jgi:Zn-finger nucleic acid-binding protein